MKRKETVFAKDWFIPTPKEEIYYIKEAESFGDLERLDLSVDWDKWDMEFDDVKEELIKQYIKEDYQHYSCAFSEFHRTKNNADFLNNLASIFENADTIMEDNTIGWLLKQAIYLIDEAMVENTVDQKRAIENYINPTKKR